MLLLKRTVSFFLILSTVLSFTGCSFDKQKEDRNDNTVEDVPEYITTYCDYPEIEGFTPIDRKDYYAYNKLSNIQKEIYNSLVKLSEEFSLEPMYFEGSKKNDITIAYNAFTDDFPQFFWVGNAYEYSEKGGWCGISFDAKNGFVCVDNIEERDEINRQINQKIKEIITSTVTPEMSDYEKELRLHDYICENMTYNRDAADKADEDRTSEELRNWSILGALFDNTGVCESYSKIFQLLLYNIGIPCTQLSGHTDDRHMWNAVKIEDEWCYVDVTWDDLEARGLEYNHSCFNMSEQILGYEHKKYTSNFYEVSQKEFQIGEFNFFDEKVGSKYYYYKMEDLVVDNNSFESIVIPALKKVWDGSSASREFCVLGNEISVERVNSMIGDLDIYGMFRGAKAIKYIRLPSGNAFVLHVTKKKD
ncbi:MAG: hypothetical protein IJ462_01840 [Clostridia bacterium]|nr:hypothetical protein [Clostridia bacterium]